MDSIAMFKNRVNDVLTSNLTCFLSLLRTPKAIDRFFGTSTTTSISSGSSSSSSGCHHHPFQVLNAWPVWRLRFLVRPWIYIHICIIISSNSSNSSTLRKFNPKEPVYYKACRTTLVSRPCASNHFNWIEGCWKLAYDTTSTHCLPCQCLKISRFQIAAECNFKKV